MRLGYFSAGIAVASGIFVMGQTFGPKHHEIIEAYNQGRKDALKTNPVSWDLEETCVGLWLGRQDQDAK